MPAEVGRNALLQVPASRTITKMKNPKPPTKHQIKSEATRTALLQAAKEIFARDGFELAQIDEIARKSGRTRGAVYAQYKTKEHLFLALIGQRIETAVREFQQLTAQTKEDDFAVRLKALREYFAEPRDPQGAILELELKLYALRHPESVVELRERYKELYPKVDTAKYFGLDQESGRSRVENRFLALGSIKSGLMLAMLFQPSSFPSKEVRLLLADVFDGLFPNIDKRKNKSASSKRN